MTQGEGSRPVRARPEPPGGGDPAVIRAPFPARGGRAAPAVKAPRGGPGGTALPLPAPTGPSRGLAPAAAAAAV